MKTKIFPKVKFFILVALIISFYTVSAFSQTVIQIGDNQTIENAYNNTIPATISTSYIIELQSSYNASESFPITLPAKTGASATNTITIKPANGVTKTLASSNSNIFEFSGADYVIIDGVNKNLILEANNTNFYAIWFYNDACYNTIKNCEIKGINNNTLRGVIYFGVTTSTSGNSFNLITNNKIHDGSSKPANLIYSMGTQEKENSDNTISKNELYNFTQSAIYVNWDNTSGYPGKGDNWIIGGNSADDGNHIYQTSNSSNTQTAIFLKPGNESEGNIIGYNYIGGSQTYAGGGYFQNTAAVRFTGIKTNVSTVSNGVTIKYNTIKNIYMSYTGTALLDHSFSGIYPDSGYSIIEYNTIGNTSGYTNSILTESRGMVCGIFCEAVYTTYIRNNTVCYIDQQNDGNTSSDKVKLRGIRYANSIGSMSGTIYIQNNSVHDLKSKGRISFADGTIYGIVFNDTSRGKGIISGNTIYNLSCYNTGGSKVYMGGIEVDDDSYNVDIFNNKIYDLYNLNKTDPMVGGIIMHIDYRESVSRTINIFNNYIYLHNVENTQLYGIWDFSNSNTTNITLNCFYNTVLISGGIVDNPSVYNESACFNRGFTGVASPDTKMLTKTTTNLINNIFINVRTGGTNKHYAIVNAPRNDADYTNVTAGWGIAQSNYNFCTTSGSSCFGVWGGTSMTTLNVKTLSEWKSSGTNKSVQDTNSWYPVESSINLNNLFTDTANGDLSIITTNPDSWYIFGKGIAGSLSGSISTDYSGNARATSQGLATCIGANEISPLSTPPNPTITGTIGVGNTQTFTAGGRTLGSILWTGGTALPSTISLLYRPGKNPPSASGLYSNGYWEINQTGGTDFTYTVTLYYDMAMIGTISNESYVRLSKYDGSNWTNYLYTTTLNTSSKTVSVSGLTSFSTFALTDYNSPLPVSLLSLTSNVIGNSVKLLWSTSSETNNSGFEIQRADIKDQNYDFKKVGFVSGKGTITTLTNYSFEDRNLQIGKYKYRLKQIDFNGNFDYYNLNNEVDISNPSKFMLSQNYPNPFNPVTKIDFEIPENSFVKIVIYDILGKEIKTLMNENKTAGYYTLIIDSKDLTSGTYFYRMEAGRFTKTYKMCVIK